MKDLSKKACSSRIYTNHSLRATSITLLDKHGFEARDIMAVSGHKSEASIRSYAQTGILMKQMMSDVISNAVLGNNQVLHPNQVSPHTREQLGLPDLPVNVHVDFMDTARTLPGSNQIFHQLQASSHTREKQGLPDLNVHVDVELKIDTTQTLPGVNKEDNVFRHDSGRTNGTAWVFPKLFLSQRQHHTKQKCSFSSCHDRHQQTQKTLIHVLVTIVICLQMQMISQIYSRTSATWIYCS